MNTGKQLRLRRIFRGERSIIVPMDHALYFGPIEQLADPATLVRRVASKGADGILVPPGTLTTLPPDALGDLAVLLRLDGTCSRMGHNLAQTSLITSVEEAVRLGVDGVVVNIYVGSENEDYLLGKLGTVAEQCRNWGMVLIGEMIPAPLLTAHYGHGDANLCPEERAEAIGVAARIGAEIGVDVLKINYSGSRDSFREVTRHAQRPALVAGGVQAGSEKEFLADIRDCLDGGAAGVCIGRNLWARDDMESMLEALRLLVHEDAPLEKALSAL